MAQELSRARTTLLTRHESDMKDNTYWLGLITHVRHMTHLAFITCFYYIDRIFVRTDAQ